MICPVGAGLEVCGLGLDLAKRSCLHHFVKLEPTPSYSRSLDQPVHFRSADAYLVARSRLSGPFSIFFRFRSAESGGLLLFAGRMTADGDFIAVELVNGVVRLVHSLERRNSR